MNRYTIFALMIGFWATNAFCAALPRTQRIECRIGAIKQDEEEIEVPREASIDVIKQAIQVRTGIPPRQQHLNWIQHERLPIPLFGDLSTRTIVTPINSSEHLREFTEHNAIDPQKLWVFLSLDRDPDNREIQVIHRVLGFQVGE